MSPITFHPSTQLRVLLPVTGCTSRGHQSAIYPRFPAESACRSLPDLVNDLEIIFPFPAPRCAGSTLDPGTGHFTHSQLIYGHRPGCAALGSIPSSLTALQGASGLQEWGSSEGWAEPQHPQRWQSCSYSSAPNSCTQTPAPTFLHLNSCTHIPAPKFPTRRSSRG